MNSDANILVQILESMNATKWVILGVILLILEVVTGTTYILWPAIAALIVGVFVFILPLSWEMQFLLFFLISSILLVIGHTHVRPKLQGGQPSDLNDRARSLIGMRVKAVADFEIGQGRVHVGDTQWRARSDDKIVSGQDLRVISVKGTTLTVQPFEE